MAKSREKQRGGLDLGKIVNSAISEGIGAIIKEHPRFEPLGPVLGKYIDTQLVNTYTKKLAETLESTPREEYKALVNDFYKTTAARVASGDFFSEKGKQIILTKSWGKKAKRGLSTSVAKEIRKGEEYLDRTMASFRDLYDLFKTGEYAQRMPELANAVEGIYDAGFKDAALNVLYANGLMDKKKYVVFKKALRQKAESGEIELKKAIDSTFGQKVVASILGILGIGAILTGSGITGNVTGVLSNSKVGIIIAGVLLLCSGILLWFKRN